MRRRHFGALGDRDTGSTLKRESLAVLARFHGTRWRKTRKSLRGALLAIPVSTVMQVGYGASQL
jgi:hypothetical protein